MDWVHALQDANQCSLSQSRESRGCVLSPRQMASCSTWRRLPAALVVVAPDQAATSRSASTLVRRKTTGSRSKCSANGREAEHRLVLLAASLRSSPIRQSSSTTSSRASGAAHARSPQRHRYLPLHRHRGQHGALGVGLSLTTSCFAQGESPLRDGGVD
jgi:hypothetical protein